MANLANKIDTFFLEEKERFIKEFSFLFNLNEDLSKKDKDNNTKDILNYFSKYTDAKDLSKLEEYLKSSDCDTCKIFSKLCESDNMNIIEYLSKTLSDKINLYLQISSKYGNLNVVKYLIGLGANPDAYYALSKSAKYGYLDIVKYLVENGAKINSCNALRNSVFGSYFEIVKYLVENGADLNNILLLTASAASGNLVITEYLVENGAKIDDVQVLYNAVVNGHLEIVKYLVKNGANINKDIVLEQTSLKLPSFWFPVVLILSLR